MIGIAKSGEPLQDKATHLSQAFLTAIKTQNFRLPSFAEGRSFALENRVSLGVAATWGFTHAAVDHVASRFFSDRFYVRSTCTYIFTGAAIWGACQGAGLGVSHELMANIALNSYLFNISMHAIHHAIDFFKTDGGFPGPVAAPAATDEKKTA